MSNNTPNQKRKFPWWALVYFVSFFVAGLGIALGVNAWVSMKAQLESCTGELEKSNSTLNEHCTGSELRLLTSDGRVDGCLCAPITPIDIKLNLKSD